MADTYEIEIMPKWAEGSFKDLASSLGEATKEVWAKTAKPLGSAVGGAAASPITGALSAISGIAGMVGQFSKFFEAFAPAAALLDQFNRAVSDVFAVVGQALMPAFEVLIPVVQMLGDYMASVMPDSKPIFDAMLPALDTIKGLLVSLAPIINQLNQLMVTGLVMGVQALVKVFDFAVKAIAQVAVWALKLIPGFVSSDLNKLQKNLEAFVAGGTGEFAKTSRGLSGQGAQKVGLQELQSQMFSAALGKSDPMVTEQQKTNGFLGMIVTAMQQKTAAEWGGGFTGNDPPTAGGGDF